MNNEIATPTIEVLFDMISAFQWLPARNSLRLAESNGIDHPILQAITETAREVFNVTNENAGNDIESQVSRRRRERLHGVDSTDLGSLVNWITQRIGIEPRKIGFSNLYATALALAIRARTPSRWNDFCAKIGKVKWQIEVADGTHFSGRLLATSCVDVNGCGEVDEVINHPSGGDARPGSGDEHGGQKRCTEKVERPEPSRRRGLVAAFEDETFNAKAEQLLNRHHQEDVAAAHTVIAGPEPAPMQKCSPFHNVIQEKIAALRSGHKGGKR